jgi:hypothetical protein
LATVLYDCFDFYFAFDFDLFVFVDEAVNIAKGWREGKCNSVRTMATAI